MIAHMLSATSLYNTLMNKTILTIILHYYWWFDMIISDCPSGSMVEH
jgi:hypothetical protein